MSGAETIEDVRPSQLADAIKAATEECLGVWQPEHGAVSTEFYRQVALRTLGHLRKTGAIGRVDKDTRDRIMAALSRIEVKNPCVSS